MISYDSQMSSYHFHMISYDFQAILRIAIGVHRISVGTLRIPIGVLTIAWVNLTSWGYRVLALRQSIVAPPLARAGGEVLSLTSERMKADGARRAAHSTSQTVAAATATAAVDLSGGPQNKTNGLNYFL